MDISGSCESLSAKTSAKRKFMHWAWKWLYTNSPSSTSTSAAIAGTNEIMEKPDATLLICLLQSIGFQLQKFEKTDIVNGSETTKLKDNDKIVKVTIECGVSKMRGILELNNIKCQCPNDEETLDASFWSVSGSVDNVNKLMETGCNLLPKIDRETNNMMHDIIYYCLNLINPSKLSEVDKTFDSTQNGGNHDFNSSFYNNATKNKNQLNDSPLIRGYTQPEIVIHRPNFCLTESNLKQFCSAEKRLSMSTQDLSKMVPIIKKMDNEHTPVLLRQKTWDIVPVNNESEPRPSPPKTSSTPVIFHDLCSSLGQISLQSDDLTIDSVADCLQKAKFYIEKAQKLHFKGSDDDVFLKPPVPPANNSQRNCRSPRRPPGSRCVSPSLSIKSLPQKSTTRLSIGGLCTTPKSNLVSPKSTSVSPKLPIRAKSIAVPSPIIKQTVDNVKKKITATKLTPSRPLTRSATSSSSSFSSASTTSAVNVNDTKITATRKRHSTLISTPKTSTLPVPKNKITEGTSNIPRTPSSLKFSKSSLAIKNGTHNGNSATPVKQDINTTLPAKFGYSSKK